MTGGTNSMQGSDRNVYKMLFGYPAWKKNFCTMETYAGNEY